MIEQTIQETLEDDSTVTGIVGTDIYNTSASRDVGDDYIIYMPVSGSPVNEDPMRERVYRITMFTTSISNRESLVDAVVDLFNKKSETMGDSYTTVVLVSTVITDRALSDYDSTAGFYRLAVDVQFKFIK
jgi:hypothetical protein